MRARKKGEKENCLRGFPSAGTVFLPETVDGIVLMGSTGEFVHYTMEERQRLMPLAVKRSRVPILIIEARPPDGARPARHGDEELLRVEPAPTVVDAKCHRVLGRGALRRVRELRVEDGWRILKTIVTLYRIERPVLFYGSIGALLLLAAILLSILLLWMLTYPARRKKRL